MSFTVLSRNCDEMAAMSTYGANSFPESLLIISIALIAPFNGVLSSCDAWATIRERCLATLSLVCKATTSE